MHIQWTKDQPTEAGYFWCRHAGGDPEVIEWDPEQQWANRIGTREMFSETHLPSCEFWPEAIRIPTSPTRDELLCALQDLCGPALAEDQVIPDVIEGAYYRAVRMLDRAACKHPAAPLQQR